FRAIGELTHAQRITGNIQLHPLTARLTNDLRELDMLWVIRPHLAGKGIPDLIDDRKRDHLFLGTIPATDCVSTARFNRSRELHHQLAVSLSRSADFSHDKIDLRLFRSIRELPHA